MVIAEFFEKLSVLTICEQSENSLPLIRGIKQNSKMISSAQEFKSLRESEIMAEYSRAANEEATIKVWNDVLRIYPDLAFWVAHNKTIQIEVLRILAKNLDPNVR